MNKKLTTAVAAFMACAGTSLFAQNAKEDVITFALTAQGQNSISVNNSPNQGIWSALPTVYKTVSQKLTQVDILRAIGLILHANPNFYSSKAALVLVQGELSGFFNLTEDLAFSDAPPTVDTGTATTFASTTFNGNGLSVRLATGRHFAPNPSGAWPPGHHQPWGQIFVKDSTQALCENVTFFFSLTVQECYDCFYLNSYITDSKFTFKNAAQSGPPCCGVPTSLTGNGKDSYYLSLTFDNTDNNPYLNTESAAYVGYVGSPYEGIHGISRANLTGDGITPDLLVYSDSILSGIGSPLPYVMSFTLNGVVTYTWNLKFINSGDAIPDFIGTAQYPNNGYGFIGLVCRMLTGKATFTERIVKASTCCLDLPWYNSWYATGWNQAQSPWPDFFPTPINTPVDLTFHFGFDENYEPGDQFSTNPTPDGTRPTQHETDVHIPVGGPAPAGD